MANGTVLNGGQINGADATDALFLKVYGGEVLTTFEETNVMAMRHVVRSIASGKSAQFPATGVVGSSYHTPGAEIVGQSANSAERIITIDDLLIADVFTDSLDEMKSHFDYRSIYSKEAGRALAIAYDTNLLQVAANAARAGSTVTGGNGGSSVVGGAGTVDATVTSAAVTGQFWDAAEALDGKDIPESDRYGFVSPAAYYAMAQDTTNINADWNGRGSWAEGRVIQVAGIEIVKTNHLPSTNVTTGPDAYKGDFQLTTMLFMQKNAIGTVKLMDLAVESSYDMRRQGHLVIAKYALGHGILRPECAIEVTSA